MLKSYTDRFEMRMSDNHRFRLEILTVMFGFTHKADTIRKLIDDKMNEPHTDKEE